MPNSERVLTRLKVMSPVMEDRSVTSILLAPKFPATREDICAVLILAFLMVSDDAKPSLVEM